MKISQEIRDMAAADDAGRGAAPEPAVVELK
jgi:hypothetical protein